MSQNPIINDRTHLSEGHLPRESKVIFFIFVSLTIGGLIKHINKKYSIAYAPLLFLIGCIGGACHESLGQFGEAIKSVSSINPVKLLNIHEKLMNVLDSAWNFNNFLACHDLSKWIQH